VGRVVAWRRRRRHPSLTLDGSLRTRLDALSQLIELTGEANREPLSSGRQRRAGQPAAGVYSVPAGSWAVRIPAEWVVAAGVTGEQVVLIRRA
jgi:hypothetical protein